MMSNPVQFRCPCGKVLASAAYGRKVKCVACGKVLVVPNPGGASPSNPNPTQAAQSPQAPVQSPFPTNPNSGFSQPSSYPSYANQPAQKNQPAKSNSKIWIIVAAAGLAGLILIGGIIAAVLVVSSSNNRVAETDNKNKSTNTQNQPPLSKKGFEGKSARSYILDPPKGYLKMEQSSDDVIMIGWGGPLRSNGSRVFFQILIGETSPGSVGADPDLQGYISGLEMEFDGFQKSPISNMPINQFQFSYTEWTGQNRRPKFPLRGLVYATRINDELVVFSLIEHADNFEQSKPRFLEFIKSYQLK